MELLVWGLVVGALLLAVGLSRRRPRTDRDWATDHARPARPTFHNGRVRLHDLRDFDHTGPGSFVERYRDVEVALDDVERAWLVLAPFARPRWRPLAHTFVSFQLAGHRFVAVSVEARRETDEPYSLVGGMLRRFEVTYVVGTERDLMGLRALRGDALYLYPSRATPDQARALFREVLERANHLRTDPEFYHTLTNNCATNLRDHVNAVVSDPLPWGWGVVFPGLLDRLALGHGLLDTTLSVERMRAHYRVDARVVEALAGPPDAFSRQVREGL